MISFVVCKDIKYGRERVWDIISDVRKIPEFWKGTRELNVVEVSKGVYEGEVKFAFPSKGKVRIEVHSEENKVIINYLKGPVIGQHEIYIDGEKVCSKWNVRLTFPFNLRERWTEEHFRSGAEHALDRVIESCAK
ncbi:SRPBCC family protein [Stygiolobus caldivivus]|uniref:SRPBCC family protein n=1 Tax=Stygiolobus caldivivus TaxID=2824673 RepID=A0A8D5U7A3_9CREN|nr:SRPBCC family protein [Stygiolobus caldivivus]BCU71020.1 hypothetical protein KN1_23170 [Stygiolobus caldivivus]